MSLHKPLHAVYVTELIHHAELNVEIPIVIKFSAQNVSKMGTFNNVLSVAVDKLFMKLSYRQREIKLI